MKKSIQTNQGYLSNTKTAIARFETVELYKDIRARVKNQIPTLSSYELYTLKEIFGNDSRWDTIERGERSAAGSYVFMLVANGMLPLDAVGKNSANARLYRRNDH